MHIEPLEEHSPDPAAISVLLAFAKDHAAPVDEVELAFFFLPGSICTSSKTLTHTGKDGLFRVYEGAKVVFMGLNEARAVACYSAIDEDRT